MVNHFNTTKLRIFSKIYCGFDLDRLSSVEEEIFWRVLIGVVDNPEAT